MLPDCHEDSIVKDCQQGRPGAYGVLFGKYKDTVYSVARRYSPSHSVSQDAAHDAVLKLFSAIGSFRGDSSLRSLALPDGSKSAATIRVVKPAAWSRSGMNCFALPVPAHWMACCAQRPNTVSAPL